MCLESGNTVERAAQMESILKVTSWFILRPVMERRQARPSISPLHSSDPACAPHPHESVSTFFERSRPPVVRPPELTALLVSPPYSLSREDPKTVSSSPSPRRYRQEPTRHLKMPSIWAHLAKPREVNIPLGYFSYHWGKRLYPPLEVVVKQKGAPGHFLPRKTLIPTQGPEAWAHARCCLLGGTQVRLLAPFFPKGARTPQNRIPYTTPYCF